MPPPSRLPPFVVDEQPKRKRGRPKKRREIRRRVSKPQPPEVQLEIARDMGMTLSEYIEYQALQARRKKGVPTKHRSVTQVHEKPSNEKIDLRKIIRVKKD